MEKIIFLFPEGYELNAGGIFPLGTFHIYFTNIYKLKLQPRLRKQRLRIYRHFPSNAYAVYIAFEKIVHENLDSGEFPNLLRIIPL